MNRADIAELIIAQLSRHKHELNQTFSAPTPAIKCGYIDHLLPEQLCEQIYHAFPDNRSMKSYLALRDYKFVAAHIPRYDAIIEETAAAFQDPQVRQLLADITGIHNQPPLSHLNSSGLLTLHPQQFIAPHQPDRQDADSRLWQVLELHYSVSPDWQAEHGGYLEYWQDGQANHPQHIEPRRNRLVLTTTPLNSWQAVSPIHHESHACCHLVSRYYQDTPATPALPKPRSRTALHHLASSAADGIGKNLRKIFGADQ